MFLDGRLYYSHTLSLSLAHNATCTGDDAFVTVSAPIGQPCLLYSQGSQYGEQLVTYLKQRKIL